MLVSERTARIFEHLCTHWAHGYTQGSGRWGGYAGEESINIAGNLSIHGGDFDCSSSTTYAWQKALEGTPFEGALGHDGYDPFGRWMSWYTANMRSLFIGSGLFRVVPLSQRRRGDILLNEGQHAAMYLGNGQIGEFWLNEHNGITGGALGDQTGWESHIRDYYDFPWDVCIQIIDDFEVEEVEVVTDNDIRRIANASAEAVMNFVQNGVKIRDRIQGTDSAANAARGALLDKKDASGRKKNANVPDRLAWMAKKQEDMQKRIDSIDRKLDEIIKSLG